MKIQYFPDTDTLYIDLADRPSTESEVISESIIVALDRAGKPVGITIEHYSQTADSTAIETILPAMTASIAA
ncbi:MAG: Uncharacterized protein YuzE [Phormidesmis priestleyi Ana]|uniref:Uncharacterized protein YuzE n=1 Tax=Phormidesmis priestleyi Ana TaxID=1666911 RepID=A0A0N8KLX1_9CYAN|nr:MAG: Uncharacterized protein YuzE [Phormidesmis priestleyi Ana]